MPFHPSQIRWSSFANRKPTKIADLWPPFRFHDPHETVDHASYPHQAQQCGQSSSIESLKAFVEKEIGLAAIHSGRSDVAFYNVECSIRDRFGSQASSYDHRRKQKHSCETRCSTDDGASYLGCKEVEFDRKPPRRARRRNLKCRASAAIRKMLKKVHCNCKCRHFSSRILKLSRPGVAQEQHLEDNVLLRSKAKHILHNVESLVKQVLHR